MRVRRWVHAGVATGDSEKHGRSMEVGTSTSETPGARTHGGGER